MKRIPTLGLLVAILIIGRYAAVANASTEQTAPLLGHLLPALSKATLEPPKPGEDKQPVTLTIVLRRDDQSGFQRYLKELYDPHSVNFHHFLTQSQIADRFGPNRAEYDRTLSYGKANKFKLLAGSDNRLTLTFRTSREDAARAFYTQINDYRIGGREFYANASAPELPEDLAPRVMAVEGLSNLAQPHHAWNAIKAAFFTAACHLAVIGCPAIQANLTACLDAAKQGNAYNGGDYSKLCNSIIPTGSVVRHAEALAPSDTPWANVNGAGQTIGLVEFDTFNQSDVVNYLAFFGHSASVINQLSEVAVDGGVAAPGANEEEVLIDVDTALSLAPGANTVVYDAPFSGAGSSFQAVFNQMVNDRVTVISNSWAYCENQTTAADVDSIDAIFQSAAGISVFNGAGDSGSTCLDGSANTVAVPADSPNATAVGGSSKNPGPNFTYGPETWWDDSATTPPAGRAVLA
jgi:kumamolisin